MPGKILLLLLAVLLSGCNNDFLGLLRSNGLDERLKERNNFRFLRPQDMELSLGNEFAFLVLTDIHIEHKNAHDFEKLTEVIQGDDEIQFVVITGDITQHGVREDIEKFIAIARRFGVPCYPVIGNHDIFFENWTNWKSLIGSTRYRIDGGGATLFMLDSANAYFGREQLSWLEREIKSASGRVFVFTHANLFIKSPVDIQQLTDVKERARICSILRDHADSMFMGHAHTRDEREIGNVQYVTIEDFKSNKTYCRVSVKRTGVSYHFKKL